MWRLASACLLLAAIVSGGTLAQGPAQFVYVLNNNFRAKNFGADAAPDPALSPSTISAYRIQSDFSLVKVVNPARSDGTFIGMEAASPPLGGAYRVWNTVASTFVPPLLAVNDYVNGPNGFSIDAETGYLAWLKSFPGQGNSGSAVALSNGGAILYSGDYFARTVRTILPGALIPIENRFPALVVTVKLSPSEERLAVGTDYRDDTFTIPTAVHILDLSATPGPNGYPEVAGSPIPTGGVSSMGGMAFAKDQKLVVAHLLSDTLRVIDLSLMSPLGGLVAFPANASQPVEVVFHPSGNSVYIACRSGHVAGYSYADGTLSPIKGSPWATGSIETQNLVVSNDGSLLYALNSGDVFASRAIQPSITGFTIGATGVLTRIGTTTLADTNYYPTGIGIYAPAPRFTSVSWSNPADIYYGTPLGAAQLDAEASVAGTIVYSPAAGTILDAGSAQSLTATFTPADTMAYAASSRTVRINVLRITPAIEWSNPADIVYGTALGPAQLDAAVSAVVNGVAIAVAGSFAYTPPAGTVLGGGSHTLAATFTPTDGTNFASVSKSVTINVQKVTPAIQWSTPADIYPGTPLGPTQLDATATAVVGGVATTVAGTFGYSPAAGTVLSIGTHTLSVQFTPTVAASFNTPAAKTVEIRVDASANRVPDVSRAAPSVACLWPPNEKLTSPIKIVGVTDPDGDAVTLEITRILQDEPTNELGDANSAIDGFGVGTAQATLRHERSGRGNGRIYEIRFAARDAKGGTSAGKVFVCVPRDQSKPALDSVIRYDSTVAGGPPLVPRHLQRATS